MEEGLICSFLVEELQLAEIARNCFAHSQKGLEVQDLTRGLEQLDFVTEDESLKGKHRVDALAELGIERYMSLINQTDAGPFNLYFEGKTVDSPEGARGSIFVDEVDGSLNMERKTGNPNLIFAYTSKTGDIKLDDIEFVFVKSYLNGDEYSAYKGRGAKFMDSRTFQTIPIRSEGPSELSEAVAYLRPGYGMAEEQIVGAYPLFLAVKDIRAFDNTGIELCEIARGAAHLMVDTRSVSDTQNLLPYLLLKEAGAVLTTLDGEDVGDISLNDNRPFNFIAASNEGLVRQTVDLLGRYRTSGLKEKLQETTTEIRERLL